MEKYAVYVVIVEDTEDDDMGLMSGVAGGERLGADYEFDEAEELTKRVTEKFWGWEPGEGS